MVVLEEKKRFIDVEGTYPSVHFHITIFRDDGSKTDTRRKNGQGGLGIETLDETVSLRNDRIRTRDVIPERPDSVETSRLR